MGEIKITNGIKVKKLQENNLDLIKEGKYCFEFKTLDYTYHIAASNENEMNDWFELFDSLTKSIPNSTSNSSLNNSNPETNNNNNNNINNNSKSENKNEKNDNKNDKNNENNNFTTQSSMGQLKSSAMKKFNRFSTAKSKKGEFEIVRGDLQAGYNMINNNSNGNNNGINNSTSSDKLDNDNEKIVRDKKQSLIQEIIFTERDYVSDLYVVLNVRFFSFFYYFLLFFSFLSFFLFF